MEKNVNGYFTDECIQKTALPDILPGKHKLELTLFGNRHNSFGPLHNADKGYRWFGPSAWVIDGDSFSYEYNLADVGIVRNPEVSFLKKK